MELLRGAIRRRPDPARGSFHLGIVHDYKDGTKRPAGLAVRFGDTTYWFTII